MRGLALLLALAVAACGPADAPAPPAPAAWSQTDRLAEIDRDLVVPTAEEAVRLDAHRGRVLVMQLASAGDDAAWAAFADASPDLQTEGATVLGIVTEGSLRDALLPFDVRHADGLDWAEALGFSGEPLTLVVGPSGRLRGRQASPSADEIVVLAAPVLLEVEASAQIVEVDVLTPAAVETLLRGGAALIDVRADGPPLAHALAVPLGQLRAQVLPLDLGTPIVFVGPDAEAASDRAADWGYAETYALVDPTGLEIAEPIDALPAYDERDDLPRVRG